MKYDSFGRAGLSDGNAKNELASLMRLACEKSWMVRGCCTISDVPVVLVIMIALFRRAARRSDSEVSSDGQRHLGWLSPICES